MTIHYISMRNILGCQRPIGTCSETIFMFEKLSSSDQDLTFVVAVITTRQCTWYVCGSFIVCPLHSLKCPRVVKLKGMLGGAGLTEVPALSCWCNLQCPNSKASRWNMDMKVCRRVMVVDVRSLFQISLCSYILCFLMIRLVINNSSYTFFYLLVYQLVHIFTLCFWIRFCSTDY